MDTKLKEMGARVREARVKMNLSQTDLAELAQLHPTYISQIENGKANMSIDVFMRLTEALQISADWLLRAEVPSVNTIQNVEINKLLADCSESEVRYIIKLIRELKAALRNSN